MFLILDESIEDKEKHSEDSAKKEHKEHYHEQVQLGLHDELLHEEEIKGQSKDIDH